MSAQFSSLMVYIHDMPRAAAFYSEVLGAKPQVESPEWTQFDLGNGAILGLHRAHEAPSKTAAAWTPSFLVDDLKSAREAAVAAGGSALRYHDIPGGVIASIADPDGNQLDLQQNGVTCAGLGVAST